MRRLLILALAGPIVLAACGGGSTLGNAVDGSGGGSGGGGTGGGGTTTTLSLGSGTGGTFQSGVIAISTSALSAGGSTSLQVSLVDQTGALYTTPTAITFSSPCQSQGLATIDATGVTPASPTVTTSTGTATATYVATGCSGSDVITASATANSQTLTASGTVTVAQAAIGSIAFISATPPNITLKGVGSAGGSATSTVIFKVLDTSGGPRAGATVTFSLNTSVGGITIAPATAVTNANGQVQTIVSGGTVATTVRVTATTTASGGTTISTQSNALTVSTGIPTSANISLAVQCQNVEAYNYDGVTVPVTVSMTDRFSNPVPDGTTANFQTALSGIQATCQTGSTTSGSGACVVNWVSKAPYAVNGNPQSTAGNSKTSPAYCTGIGQAMGLCNGTSNGRSAIMVTAIGEESFKDANGSGVFNTTTDTVPWNATDADNNFMAGQPNPNNGTAKPWFDTSEPFLNEWELYDSYGTPIFVSGEPFIDFNNNGTRDGPDGLVQSALCEGALCSTTGSSVSISANNLIILSGSDAWLSVLGITGGGTQPNGTIISGQYPNVGPVYSVGGGLTLTVEIYDGRLQQMPAKTTVSASISTGSTETITSPAPAAWPCSTGAPFVAPNGSQYAGQTIAGMIYQFTIAPSTAVPQVGGTLFINVTTPRGLVTTFGIGLTP
jgi:hypothetical protein